MRRYFRLMVAGAMCALPVVALDAAAARAQGEPPTTEPSSEDTGTVTGGQADTTPVTLPLIPVPSGCTAPALPHIVFVGEAIDRDYRTIRFDIDRVRSGRLDPFSVGGEIDVRYGLDAQYIHTGSTYLVSAVIEPDLGILVSRVTEPIENFGGDEVIGVSETDANCPDFEDPKRTLYLDGTDIEGGVLKPFFDAKMRILGAFLVPFAVAMGAIFLLSMFRLSVSGLYHSVLDVSRRRT